MVNDPNFHSPKTQILHRAVTSRGIIQYEFLVSPRIGHLIAKLRETGLGGHVAQNLAYEFSRQSYRQEYYQKIKDCRDQTENNSDRIAECFPVRTDNFLLEFYPFEELWAITGHE